MKNIFRNIADCIARRKALFILFIVLALVMLVIGVVSAINFNTGVLPIDLGNITFIKFLRGSSGFFSLIFNTMIASIIIYAIMTLCCCKNFLIPFAIIFYLYFIYCMGVVWTSIMLIYGFFATIILLILLLAFYVCEIFILTVLLCELITISKTNYFKCCFNNQTSCVVILSTMLLVLIVTFCLILACLKSYIILLIY